MKIVQELHNIQINPKIGEDIDNLLKKAIIDLLEGYVHSLKYGYIEPSLKNYIGFKIETLNYDTKLSLMEYEE